MSLRRNRRRFLLLPLFTLLLLSSGCAVVVGGMIGGGVAGYFKGVLKTEENATFDNVWLAVVETVEQEEFEIVRKESGIGKALVEAKVLKKKDTVAYVTVAYKKPEVTKISIRVGVFGDEEESRRILGMIKEKLYRPAPESP